MEVKKILLASLITLNFSTFADEADAAKKLAQEVPIADVHRHVQRWISPDLLKQQMEKNNVKWSGAVGAPFGPFDTAPYSRLLKNKYIPTAGQVELSDIFGVHGAAGLTDINLRTYQELLEGADKMFLSGLSRAVMDNHRGNLSLDKDYSDGARFVIEFRLPNNSK